MATRAATLALFAWPGAVAAEAEQKEITCDWPVRSGDTAETVRERFGNQAKVETLIGGEGYEFEGMVLWPDDPARRVEVLFEEDNPSLLVSGLRFRGEANWQVAGIGRGVPLEMVREVNAAPFELWGFDWDYGGYVASLGGGRLASLPGGCTLSLRFSRGDDVNLPGALAGEVKLSSDDPQVRAAKARVSQIVVSYDLGDEPLVDPD